MVKKVEECRKMMKKCRATITTVADGQENTIMREGEMELFVSSATLIYREENGSTRIHLEKECADIERIGDYTMRLRLVRGERTDGEIGLGGSTGGIEALTRRVQYSITEQSLLLSLHYDLIISGERQKMQIRLKARFI